MKPSGSNAVSFSGHRAPDFTNLPSNFTTSIPLGKNSNAYLIGPARPDQLIEVARSGEQEAEEDEQHG